MYNNWEELEKSIINCKKCKLCAGRSNIVFGEGNKEADIMLIGEGPGADEDKQGLPFVGKAGQLMNKAFQGLGIDRNKVYIANVVKCRPPGNRVPEPDEAKECLDYLRNQVILVKPKIIVLLGFLIIIHELGHFLVAKLCKVKVNEFSIGFGPGIWTKQGNETKYSLRAIPLRRICGGPWG